MMRRSKRYFILFILFLFYLLWESEIVAQTKVIRALNFQQITHFENELFVASMKMSADGSKIVFSTSGPTVKVYTINMNGTGLTQIFDFERQGYGPSVDISGDGNKIVWCDGFGELYSANSDGSEVYELATLIPNPDPVFADFEPEIPLPPRITLDGSQIFFINATREPIAAGVWRIDYDGSNLKQIFNYLEMSQNVFGRDGYEYNPNSAFADGFSISGDGSTMIFGTRIFKIENGDFSRGDAVVLRGGTFYKLGEYATGNQSFATDQDGENFFMFKREFNPEKGDDEINILKVPLGTGDPIKLIGGLSIFAAAQNLQLTGDGKKAIVIGGMRTPHEPPISLIDAVTQSQIDLVNVDGASIKIANFRMSLSTLPSINANGDMFCFLAPSVPQQIWIGRIGSNAVNSEPSITNVAFNPDFVSSDFSTKSTFIAHVQSTNGPILSVQFSALRDGAYVSRVLASAFPFTYLMDDGSFGDEFADDAFFTNNDVHKDLPETTNGFYTVRIDATDGQNITAVDAEPFSIRDVTSKVSEAKQNSYLEYDLYQNYPNPFNPNTTIFFKLPHTCFIILDILNVHGEYVTTLFKGVKDAGFGKIRWNGTDESGKKVTNGIYFIRLIRDDFVSFRKMTLLK